MVHSNEIVPMARAHDEVVAEDSTEAQRIRVALRLRAIASYSDLVGRACEITLLGDASPCASGVFRGVDSGEECYLVESLESALGTTKRARVRVREVSSLRFEAAVKMATREAAGG